MRLTIPLVSLALGLAAAMPARAFQIQFDYRLDTAGFFTDNPQAKVLLEAVGNYYASMLGDTFDPYIRTGRTVSLPDGPSGTFDLSVPANTLLIFAGGVDYTGALGKGGPVVSGSVNARGEIGANPSGSNPTDFAPGYGVFGVDISRANSTPWYFDPDPTTPKTFSGYDFYTVALHEVGHVLGIGTAPSFDRWINAVNPAQPTFMGPTAMAVMGGVPVPLDADQSHWQGGLTAPIGGTGAFPATMDPGLSPDVRELLTDLDIAALRDIGWEVTAPVPEPATWALWLAGIGLLAGRARRAAAAA